MSDYINYDVFYTMVAPEAAFFVEEGGLPDSPDSWMYRTFQVPIIPPRPLAPREVELEAEEPVPGTFTHEAPFQKFKESVVDRAKCGISTVEFGLRHPEKAFHPKVRRLKAGNHMLRIPQDFEPASSFDVIKKTALQLLGKVNELRGRDYLKSI